jgi:hypothetical protein
MRATCNLRRPEATTTIVYFGAMTTGKPIASQNEETEEDKNILLPARVCLGDKYCSCLFYWHRIGAESPNA